jgi:ABC-type uncharacterized transport system auxiliary subunit
MIMRRATGALSPNLVRSEPIKTISALSRATLAPDGRQLRKLSGTRRRATVPVFVTLVLFASACGQARPTKYYHLAFPHDPSSARAKANDLLPVTLLVGHLRASHLYREDRIVYAGRSEQVGTYEYRRWAEPPTEMIEQMLLRELRATGHYQGIYSLSSESRGDYVLHGSLLDLKEISGDSLLARVTLDLQLREVKTGRTVWTHYYTHDEPVNANDISAVVAALNRNVQRGINEIRVSLDEYFTTHPPE